MGRLSVVAFWVGLALASSPSLAVDPAYPEEPEVGIERSPDGRGYQIQAGMVPPFRVDQAVDVPLLRAVRSAAHHEVPGARLSSAVVVAAPADLGRVAKLDQPVLVGEQMEFAPVPLQQIDDRAPMIAATPVNVGTVMTSGETRSMGMISVMNSTGACTEDEDVAVVFPRTACSRGTPPIIAR